MARQRMLLTSQTDARAADGAEATCACRIAAERRKSRQQYGFGT